jgi:hypothetical protein
MKHSVHIIDVIEIVMDSLFQYFNSMFTMLTLPKIVISWYLYLLGTSIKIPQNKYLQYSKQYYARAKQVIVIG